MEILLSPPFVADECYKLSFMAVTRLSSSWALALLIFSLYNLMTSCSPSELLGEQLPLTSTHPTFSALGHTRKECHKFRKWGHSWPVSLVVPQGCYFLISSPRGQWVMVHHSARCQFPRAWLAPHFLRLPASTDVQKSRDERNLSLFRLSVPWSNETQGTPLLGKVLWLERCMIVWKFCISHSRATQQVCRTNF